MRTVGIFIAVVLTAGCAPVMKSHQMYAVSKGTYAPENASSVWARALQEFQVRNASIGVANRDAGVLASPVQSSATVSCGSGDCQAVTSLQFTQYDGVAMLNIWRRIEGLRDWDKPLTTDSDYVALQRQVDEALSRIVGTRAKPAELPAVPTPKPPRLKQVGETCSEHTDCASGTCSGAKCVR